METRPLFIRASSSRRPRERGTGAAGIFHEPGAIISGQLFPIQRTGPKLSPTRHKAAASRPSVKPFIEDSSAEITIARRNWRGGISGGGENVAALALPPSRGERENLNGFEAGTKPRIREFASVPSCDPPLFGARFDGRFTLEIIKTRIG